MSSSSGLRPLSRARCVSLAAAILILLGICDAFPVSRAHAADTTGTIEGRVFASVREGYLEKAKVVLENAQREVFTDETGFYRLTDVPAGLANLRVQYTGFPAQKHTVEVSAGQTVQHNITLTASGANRGAEDAPIQLSSFVVGGAREMDGAAISINEQRYPHDLRSGVDAPEAVGLLRKLLAAQPEASVALVQVGFFTNFARLLDSKPDEFSPLSGRDLIAKKVKLLAIMAGAFQTINSNTRYLEYNVIKDVPAAQALAKRWPSPVVWSGFEIGIAATFPHVSIEQDLNYVAHHPLKESYVLYNPPPHDRPTWDPTALLYAVYPERGYFALSSAGTVTVEDNGATWFRPGKDGKGGHRFLVMSPEQTTRVREAIVQLSVEPPARFAR